MNEPAPGLVIFGGGRMGRQLVDHHAEAGFRLLAVVSRSRPAWLEDGPWINELAALEETPGALIDFSLPGGTVVAADWCAEHAVPLVSGTTGLEEADTQALDRAARSAPVLWSSNFSLGVNAALRLVQQAAALLEAAEVTVTDVHHVHKRDAPSGTALTLGGATGREVRYHSEREGEVIGDHEVLFRLPGEELAVVHRARDRAIYARGALAAARWLAGRAPGRYRAGDWLG